MRTEAIAKDKKTGKESTHTYTYNAYGDVTMKDDTVFVYDDVSGQVTKEMTKLTKKARSSLQRKSQAEIYEH